MMDGYEWVRKAIALRGSDPQMEFAAALMTTDGARAERDRHLQNAMAGAKEDALLARNLASRFSQERSVASHCTDRFEVETLAE